MEDDSQRRLLDALFADGLVGVAVTKVGSGEFVRANHAFCQLIGRSQEAILGRTAKDLALWVDPEERTGFIRRIEAGEAIGGFHWRFRRADGSTGWALVSVRKVQFPEGPVLVSTLQDITLLQQRQAELVATRAELEFMEEVAEMGSYWLDPTTQATYWSRGMRVMYGLDPEAPLDRDIARTFTLPEDRDRALTELSAAITSRGTYDITYRIKRPDGAIRAVRAHGKVVNPTTLVGTLQDITHEMHGDVPAGVMSLIRQLCARVTDPKERRAAGVDLVALVQGLTPTAAFERFGALGLGDLKVTNASDGSWTIEGASLVEKRPHALAPTCHLTLAFLEGFLSTAQAPVRGAELRCESMGAKHCEFALRRRPA